LEFDVEVQFEGGEAFFFDDFAGGGRWVGEMPQANDESLTLQNDMRALFCFQKGQGFLKARACPSQPLHDDLFVFEVAS
jgi:hypothetical protein